MEKLKWGCCSACGRGGYSGKDTQRKHLYVVAEWKHGRLPLVKATFKPLLLGRARNSCSFIKGYRSGLPPGRISTHVCGRLSVSRLAFSCRYFVLLVSRLLMASFPTDKIIFFCFCFVLMAPTSAARLVWAEQEPVNRTTSGHVKMHLCASGKMCGRFFFSEVLFFSLENLL